jgi:hypothetical protein
VSVRISAGEITEAHFVECKLRTIKHSGAALSAYAQLATDQEAQFATIIMFTLARLDETNHPLFEPFLRYLERRANQELDTYGIFLAVENAICITDPAAEIAEIDRAIAPLHIRVVRISALANLITTVYERLGATPELEPDDVL